MALAAACLATVLALAGSGCAPATGVYHVVEPGQTLYRIAKTYDVDASSLAKANNLADPDRLAAGQRLYIPGASLPRNVPADDPRKASPPPPPRAKQDKPAAATRQTPAASTAKPGVSPEEIPGLRSAPGTFVWPVRGKMVSEFGTEAGKSTKGVEIAVAQGTPVVAAAAGKVIYSGSGIRGYGNLIILEHADNYFTVYGFNAKNLVAVDSFVGQGQKIALSGVPSASKSPRLHFEIRKGKAAVNPIFYLP